MHHILEIALGVGLGMTIFLVIIWLLGTCVYICCGKTKKIATVRKLKTYQGKEKDLTESEVVEEKEDSDKDSVKDLTKPEVIKEEKL
jgi:hypothetical protein